MNSLRFSRGIAGSVAVCLFLFLFAACDKAKTPSSSSPKLVPQDRFAWNIKTLVEAYGKAGYANRAWDEPARRALTEFARVRSHVMETNEPWAEIIATNCNLAVQAGCNDPMIAYLHTRFFLDQTNSSKVFADAFVKTAREMQQSSYPSTRKFYAALRAAEQLKFVAGNSTPREVHEFRHLAATELASIVTDRSTPIGEVDEACQEMFKLVERNNQGYEEAYRLIEKPLFENWQGESVSWLLKGQFYIKYAWAARGGGYANTVSEEGWKLFKERLATAETALARSWELNPKDPRIAIKMIWVELGQSQGRNRMELWFRRAMELDPNNYDACNAKLLYLEPKWYGSIEEMLRFGRECVQSKDWGGHVPLVLVDAHDEVPLYYLEKSEQAVYWKRPEVWPDIKVAFEKFFWLNPDEFGWHHNYARYAYRCEQWDELNEQLAQLGPVNRDFFGGNDEFDKMVRLAKEHAAGAKPRETK